MDLIEFNKIVMCMKVRKDVCAFSSLRQFSYLLPPDRFEKLPSPTAKEVRHATGDDNTSIRRVVDKVIQYAVLSALPDQDARRVRIDSTDMVNVIVVDEVIPVDVFGARTVTAQHNAIPSKVLDQVPGNRVLSPVQVDANRTASALGKSTILNRTILSSPQPKERVSIIVHAPVVLQSGIIFIDAVALAMHERKTSKC